METKQKRNKTVPQWTPMIHLNKEEMEEYNRTGQLPQPITDELQEYERKLREEGLPKGYFLEDEE